jgi:DNA-binding SARP family transcriptional activator
VQFRILGPVQVWSDHARVLSLRRRQERCLLAILLLEVGRVVPAGRLSDLLWDNEPPVHARQALRTCAARIRAVMTQAGAATHGVTLVFDQGGYVLKAAADIVDVHRFRDLVDRADRAAQLAERYQLLSEALDLWRGPALADAATGRIRQRLCADLDELHLRTREDFVATGVARGRHHELLPELARLCAEHPTRQRLVELHMLALYRDGRTADALDLFQQARGRLADDLGVDPDPALQRLYTTILRGEPASATSLPQATVTASQPTAGQVRPAQLPADLPSFTGRVRHLDQLDALLPRHASSGTTAVVISAIHGTAGVGKSALAVHWAHRVADYFPDGQLYVNLRGFDPGGQAMDAATAVRGFLDALEVPPQRIPTELDEQAALYRSILAGKRMLIVLDNARDTAQVRPLLPGAAGCLALVTSRSQLTSLAAANSAYQISLDLLTYDEARNLLAVRLGTDRVAAEPQSVADIITRCARLPLALTLFAAHATNRPHTSLQMLAEELRDTQQRWQSLRGDDPATDIRTVFSWSYRTLTPPAARLFRLLGLPPGPDISITAAASLAGEAVAAVRPLLDELTRVNLITEYAPGRYILHDLLRAYAIEQAHAVDPDGERLVATRRILDHYLYSAYQADALFNPHRDYRDPIAVEPAGPGVTPEEHTTARQALDWFGRDLPVLLAAIEQSAAIAFHTHAWQLAWSLAIFLDRQGRWNDLMATQQTALDSAQRLADRTGQANAHHLLGRAQMWLGRQHDGDGHLRRAMELYRELASRNSEARAHVDVAVRLLKWEGAPREALKQAQRAVDLYRTTDYQAGVASALPMVGWCHVRLGNHELAVADCQHALDILQDLGDRRGQSWCWKALGFAYHGLGKPDEVITCCQHALDLLRDLGDRYQEADVLTLLGDAHSGVSNPDAAHDAYQQALTILDDLNHPDADTIRAKLAAVDSPAS